MELLLQLVTYTKATISFILCHDGLFFFKFLLYFLFVYGIFGCLFLIITLGFVSLLFLLFF